jgi:hypothetical protein
MKLHISEQYLFRSDDMDAVAEALGRALGVRATTRESEFLGGRYKSLEDDMRSEIDLFTNFNSAENDWHEPQFKEYGLVLWLDYPGAEPKYGLSVEAELSEFEPLLLQRLRYDASLEGEAIAETEEILFEHKKYRARS